MNTKYIDTSYIMKDSPIDKLDMEKFILEVRKRECIWNVNSKSYNLKCIRNRETKKRAWEEIGRIFDPNWNNLTVENRQKKVEALSKKWANIRKYYTDEVRKNYNCPPKKRQRTYHHLLTFLDNSVHKRRIPRINEFKNIGKEKYSTDSSSDSESGELFIVENTEVEKHFSPQHKESTVDIPALSDNDSKHPDAYSVDKHEAGNVFNIRDKSVTPAKCTMEKKSTVTEMMKKNPQIIKLLNEAQSPPPINNNFLYLSPTTFNPIDNTVLPRSLELTAEANKNFLLSLLPEVMSLNVIENLQFRLGVADLLNEIKLKVE